MVHHQPDAGSHRDRDAVWQRTPPQAEPLEPPRRAMCSRRERALLVPYALTGCRPDEGVAFEAHLLQCDACFEDLQLLDSAAALIGDWAVARVTLADLFYNAPRGDGPHAGLRAVLDSIAQDDVADDVGPASCQA